MSLDNSFTEIAEANHEEVCPFLGMAQDSQTSMSYPSAANFCHRSKPYGTPKLDFQQSFCFSDNHTNCPVFTRTGRAPLPADILFKTDRSLPKNRVILPWLIGGIVLLLGVIGVLWWIQNPTVHGGSLFGILGDPSPSATSQLMATGTAPFTDTPAFAAIHTATLQPPSLTPTLVLTNSPTQTPTPPPSFTPTSTRKIYILPTPVPTNTFYFANPTLVPPTDTSAPPTDTSAPTAPPT
jgi:hypothetical protein